MPSTTAREFSDLVENTSDVTFRLWATNVGFWTGVTGMVQTADTGQINLGSVTRAALNTAAGYQIWRLADSTLYMKFEYGTGTATANPQMWITVGTGSNGSGTITGQTSTRSTIFAGAPGVGIGRPSLICTSADSWGLAFGFQGAGTFWVGFCVVGKTVDTTGAATTTGFGVLRLTTSGASLQCVRIAATAATFADNVLGIVAIPGTPTSSLRYADGLYQAYQCWMNTPDGFIFKWACVVLPLEVPYHTGFTARLPSPTAFPWVYISLDKINGGANVGAYSGTYSWAMYWN